LCCAAYAKKWLQLSPEEHKNLQEHPPVFSIQQNDLTDGDLYNATRECPVCDKYVKSGSAYYYLKLKDRVVPICSPVCLEELAKDEKWIS
jgi:hypothetical protein